MIDRKEVISVTDDFTLAKAIDRMELYGMRALPVVNYGRYHGVIEKSSIFEHIYIKRDVDLDVAIVRDVMRSNIQVVYASDFIEKAAVAFRNHRYQFLPVMMDDTEDQFLGIITATTILNILASALGLGHPAHRLTLQLPGYKGELARISRALYQSGVNITSFVTVSYEESRDIFSDSSVSVVLKFEGDLEAALTACRAQGAVITHVDRFEG